MESASHSKWTGVARAAPAPSVREDLVEHAPREGGAANENEALGRFPPQNRPLSPADHLRLLHEGRRGMVTVARKSSSWHERTLIVEDAVEYVATLDGVDDVFVSQNRFRGRRRGNRLAELSALFCDLDFYKSGYAGHSVNQIVGLVLDRLDDRNIPAPSLIMFSGRGLQFVWLHDPIPPQAEPRWRRCQDEIHAALADLGADAQARDACRLLRLAGTRNPESGEIARPLRMSGRRWDFDILADEILPLTRAALSELRQSRSAICRPRKSNRSHDPGLLWRDRFDELERLAAHRGPNGLPPGERDQLLFLMAVALSWLVPFSMLEAAILNMARRRCPAWSKAEVLSNMMSVIDRAGRAARGERAEWKGHPIDPRYRFTSAEIVRRLKVTADEIGLLGLRHLTDAAQNRTCKNADRQRKHRRSRGAMPRQEFQASAHTRQVEAFELRQTGLSWREVGERMGISGEAARQLARRHREKADRSVTLYSGEATSSKGKGSRPEAIAPGARAARAANDIGACRSSPHGSADVRLADCCCGSGDVTQGGPEDPHGCGSVHPEPATDGGEGHPARTQPDDLYGPSPPLGVAEPPSPPPAPSDMPEPGSRLLGPGDG